MKLINNRSSSGPFEKNINSRKDNCPYHKRMKKMKKRKYSLITVFFLPPLLPFPSPPPSVAFSLPSPLYPPPSPLLRKAANYPARFFLLKRIYFKRKQILFEQVATQVKWNKKEEELCFFIIITCRIIY